jgi:hypothetical protein
MYLMSQSEVARIRAQIELECEAMERGFRGFAITARHDFINHRLSQIGACQEQLEQLVGEDEARKVVAETYKQAMEAGNDSKGAQEVGMTAHASLSYHNERGRWEGEEEIEEQHVLIWVDDATLEGHVRAQLQTQGITQPTLAQAISAVKSCLCLSHWQGCPDAQRVSLEGVFSLP